MSAKYHLTKSTNARATDEHEACRGRKSTSSMFAAWLVTNGGKYYEALRIRSTWNSAFAT